MIKFNYDEKTRERKQQDFDRKSIHWIKNGEKVNVYDFIQEGREDTEIYPTLEKYGSIKRMELDTPAVYQKFEKINDLRDHLEQQKEAVNMWNALPLDIRQQFNNDRYEFMNNGMQWLEKRMKTIKEKEAAAQTAITTPQTEIKKATNNG